jgi:hypothetical protein
MVCANQSGFFTSLAFQQHADIGHFVEKLLYFVEILLYYGINCVERGVKANKD